MNPDCGVQRVFNVYHHLKEGTYPPDLWDEPAELAAMVYLAVHHPAVTAFDRLQAVIEEYNRVNRALGLPLIAFDQRRAERKLHAISRYIACLPRSMHIGEVYASLLIADKSVADIHGHVGRRKDSAGARPSRRPSPGPVESGSFEGAAKVLP